MAYLIHCLIVAKEFRVLVGDVFAYVTSAFEHLSASQAPELLFLLLPVMVFGDDRELAVNRKVL